MLLYPVEYKHGKLRNEQEYNIQLCAQAMCLEEMYHTVIPEGAIFYLSSHRRQTVSLDEPLRRLVRETAEELHRIRGHFVHSEGKIFREVPAVLTAGILYARCQPVCSGVL